MLDVRTSSIRSVSRPVAWAELIPTPGRGEAWRQAHRAVQVVGEVGRLWGQPSAGHRHLSTTYHQGVRALVTEVIRGDRRFRVGFQIDEPAMLVLGEAHSVLQRFEMGGRTLFEARTWLLDHAEKLAGEPARNQPLREARLDAHPLMEGIPFGTGCGDGFRQVDQAYANTAATLRAIAEDVLPGNAVRCWPQSFCLRTEIEIESDSDEPGSIALGLSPADERQERAYFYAEPSRWPVGCAAPKLELGEWIGDESKVAVLPVWKVADRRGSLAQGRMADEFLRSAYSACERLLGG
jgi:hypothetical protein